MTLKENKGTQRGTAKRGLERWLLFCCFVESPLVFSMHASLCTRQPDIALLRLCLPARFSLYSTKNFIQIWTRISWRFPPAFIRNFKRGIPPETLSESDPRISQISLSFYPNQKFSADRHLGVFLGILCQSPSPYL
jgi:hypothetical protein